MEQESKLAVNWHDGYWNRKTKKCKVHFVTYHEGREFDTRWVWVVNATLRPLYLHELPLTHFIGGCKDSTAGMDGCGRSPFTGIRSPNRLSRRKSYTDWAIQACERNTEAKQNLWLSAVSPFYAHITNYCWKMKSGSPGHENFHLWRNPKVHYPILSR